MSKFLGISLIIFTSLVMVGCTPSVQITPDGTQSEQQTDQQSGNGSASIDVNSCITNCNIVAGDLAATCTQGCWIQEAERVGDADLCMDNLDEEVLQIGCVANVAEAKQDPDLCAVLGDSADMCYTTYASDQKDTSVCSKIQDSMFRAICEESDGE